jgi:hypothetical protein
MAIWGHIAPEPEMAGGTLVLTLMPPNVPDPNMPPAQAWTEFKNEIDDFLKALKYDSPERAASIAKLVTDAVLPYAVDRVSNWPGPKDDVKKIALPKAIDVPWLLGFPATGFKYISIADPKGWVWGSDPPQEGTDGAARSIIAKLLTDNGLSSLSAIVCDAMRARAIAQRRHQDTAPKHNLSPMQSDRIPNGIDLEKLPKLSPENPIDLLAIVKLPAYGQRTAATIEAAFTALEAIPNTGDTLVDLATLLRTPMVAANIAMRWSAKDVVVNELKRLSDKSLELNIALMVASMPATRDESAKFLDAHAKLPGLADELSEAMLFGPRRRLLIQAFHGLAAPDEDIVQRAAKP